MKKSLLVTIDFPPKLGGVAQYYQNICSNLPKDKIVVLTNKLEGSAEFDKQQQYKIYRKDLLYKIFWPKWLKMIKQIKKIVKQENIEQIYVGQILPVGEAAMLVNLPMIIFTHGMDITMPQKNKRKKTILKRIIKKSNKLIANSNFTKQELIKLGAYDEQVHIVHPCPDRKFIQMFDKKVADEIKQKYSIANKKIILSVGRLVERKDFDKVIESLTLVKDEFPDITYVIAGDGPDKNNLLYTIDKLDLKGKVILLGNVNDKELSVLYNLANIFIMTPKQLPSGDVEGFGTVYLEANMFGKPIIATSSGGVGDAVIDNLNGILIKKASINEISDAIIKLLKDKELADKLGQQGKDRVEKEFNWSKQISKLINL